MAHGVVRSLRDARDLPWEPMTPAEGIGELAGLRALLPESDPSANQGRHLPRLAVRAAVAAAAGLLLAVAFPPFGAWWLAPPVIALATLLVRDLRPRDAAIVGLAFGSAFFLLLLKWLLVIGWNSWLLLSVTEAAFIALLFAGVALVCRLPFWPAWVACLWTLEELARGNMPFGGFPWGRLAFSAADAPYRGYAALGGMPLVTFAVALIGALLAAAIVKIRTVPRANALATGSLVAGAAVVLLAGLAVPLPTSGRTVTAAVIQGDVPRQGLDAFSQAGAVLRNHADTTDALAARVAAGTAPKPDLVVWPENASDLDPYVDAGAATVIQSAVDAIGAPTLVGAVVANPADPNTVLNTGIVWAPRTATNAGGPGARYVKQHLVPFGEYVPFRSLLTRWISELGRVPRDFAPGDKPGILQLGPVRIGDVICFEVAYDPVVHAVAAADPGLLVVQTNNATYGFTGQPDQQLAMSQLRAIETGRSVLIAATSGFSAVVAPDGRLVARSEEFVPWTYDGPVTVRTGETLATRLGAAPEFVLGTLGATAVVVAIVRRRRLRSRSRDANTSTP
jgi:apolipoprotein N-acyltransferase